MDACTRSTPPGGGWKSERWVSSRPDVQLPALSLSALMWRLPWPSRKTLLVLELMLSTSPVPQFGGPPGAPWPRSKIQLEPDGEVLAAPLKSSVKMLVKPVGGGGAAASDAPGIATIATSAAA